MRTLGTKKEKDVIFFVPSPVPSEEQALQDEQTIIEDEINRLEEPDSEQFSSMMLSLVGDEQYEIAIAICNTIIESEYPIALTACRYITRECADKIAPSELIHALFKLATLTDDGAEVQEALDAIITFQKKYGEDLVSDLQLVDHFIRTK